MSRKIPVAYALKKIQAHKPTSPHEFAELGLFLRRLQSGVFRESYRIANCDLVVKFPLGNAAGRGSAKYKSGKLHTRAEIARIKRLSRTKFIQPYLPTVHYYHPPSGTVVMSYHPPFKDREEQVDSMGRLIQLLILKSTGVRSTDLHSDNLHRKSNVDKGVVLIDLGY